MNTLSSSRTLRITPRAAPDLRDLQVSGIAISGGASELIIGGVQV